MARTTSEDVKRSLTGRTAAVIGAVAGLIAAATPGIIGIMDRSAEIAKLEAEKSSEKAQKSEEKTELAYVLLREKLMHLEDDVADLQEQIRSQNQLWIEILQERASEGSRRVSRRRPASVSGRGVASLGANVSAGSGGASVTLDEPEDAVDVLQEQRQAPGPAQKPAQLPSDLDKEWKKRRPPKGD